MTNALTTTNPGPVISESDTIRPSTDQDLAAIRPWVAAQEGARHFSLCWIFIEEAHRVGELTIYVDGQSQTPVAFQPGPLNGLNLTVRSDMQGRGIERRLVEHCIQKAWERDECFVLIEDGGSYSELWEEMGFKYYGDPEESQVHEMYLQLARMHTLPTGKAVGVSISFGSVTEWEGIRPIQTSTPDAVLTNDGIIHLRERVAFCKEIHELKSDAYLTITCDGSKAFNAKVMYLKAIGGGALQHKCFLHRHHRYFQGAAARVIDQRRHVNRPTAAWREGCVGAGRVLPRLYSPG